MNGFIIVAGKTEGFEYKDGHTAYAPNKDEVKNAITTLTILGYKVFIVSEIIQRIDEFFKTEAE